MSTNDKSEDWKVKYFKQEETLKALSSHCFKVVDKYEEVIKKFNENKNKYDAVVKRLDEREKQLSHIRKLLEPVYAEYSTLKEKYEIELECRHEAEKYASKITKENRVLKRQSQAFLDDHEGEVPVENETDTFKPYLDTLNAKITELEEEKATLSSTYNQQNEDFAILRDDYSALFKKNDVLTKELEQCRVSIVQYKDSLKQVTSVSEAAYEEYENLKNEYEKATVCQNTAETFATEMYAQSEAMKRQSAVLLSSAMSDDRLMKALIEVETLTQEVEMMKKDHQNKVKDYERELEELKDKDIISTLESDNQQLHEERDQLSTQLIQLQTQYCNYEKQYKTLESQYTNLEKKYEDVLHPPPPPPPPLPPISVIKHKGFLSRSQSKRTKERNIKLAVGGVKANEDYNKAINEMMSRIKQGNQSLRPVLKPVRRPSCPEDNAGAMEELHTMLSKMKRNRSVGDLLTIDDDEDYQLPESELKSAFQKIKKTEDKSKKTLILEFNQFIQSCPFQKNGFSEDSLSHLDLA